MKTEEKLVLLKEFSDRFGQWWELVFVILRKILALDLSAQTVKDLIEDKEHRFWKAFDEATKFLPLQSMLKPADYMPTMDDFLVYWPKFCEKFGLKVEIDFEALKSDARIANRRKGFDWFVYRPIGFSARDAINILKRLTPKFNVVESLRVEGYKSTEKRPKKPHIVLCRATVEPDGEWRISADNMAETETPFLDNTERYLLEAFYYWLTKELTGVGRHLDIVGWTRCPRSRTSVGRVARADWGGGFFAYWHYAVGVGPFAGGREAEPLVP